MSFANNQVFLLLLSDLAKDGIKKCNADTPILLGNPQAFSLYTISLMDNDSNTVKMAGFI